MVLIGLIWALSAAGVAWCCLQAFRKITYVTLADGQLTSRRLPVLIRLLLPLAPNFTGLFDRPAFEEPKKRTEQDLVACGLDEVMRPADFLALRLLVPVVLGVILIGLLRLTLPAIPGKIGLFLEHRRWFLYAAAIVVAVAYPGSWLRMELRIRHWHVQRALPFVLDLLTLSVEAGMDFMSALQRIVDRREVDALGEELIRVIREIQLGKTRREALRNMAERMRHPDVRAVTGALVQADEMGVSIGSMLRIQADQMRLRRFQRAEKLAHEAPVKMLFPLVAFIFPAVFLVLMGPVFLEMARQWF